MDDIADHDAYIATAPEPFREMLTALRRQIAEHLPRPAVEVDLVVPYDRGDLVSRAHSTGEVLREEHLAEGTHLHARVDEALAAELHGAA